MKLEDVIANIKAREPEPKNIVAYDFNENGDMCAKVTARWVDGKLEILDIEYGETVKETEPVKAKIYYLIPNTKFDCNYFGYEKSVRHKGNQITVIEQLPRKAVEKELESAVKAISITSVRDVCDCLESMNLIAKEEN